MSPKQEKPIVISQKLFGLSLKLFPKEHMMQFGDEMQFVFTEDCIEIYRQAGFWGLIKLWILTINDLTMNLGYEHVRAWKYKLHNRHKERILMDEKQISTRHYFLNGLYWMLGGMLGGLVTGFAFVPIYGMSWLAIFGGTFTIVVGAVAGIISFVIYTAVYNYVLHKTPPLRS